MGRFNRFHFILFALFLVLYGLLVTQKINLATADLGRHIKNGEMVLQKETREKVLTTNLYSYTFLGFPFLNHHWGSGVIFYLVHQAFGFNGISVLFLIVSLTTFGLFFDIAGKKSNFETAFLVSILLLPLMVDRTEIRPEAFSYLLMGVFLWVLSRKEKTKKLLLVLPLLQLLWVNLHVYFFFGLFLIGVFLMEAIIKRNLKETKELGKIFLLSTLASCFNPAGLKGVLYPFLIFGNYGYRVLENQSVWFLDKIIKYPASLYFKISFALLPLSWIFVFLKRKKVSLFNLILTFFISYLGWTAVRNFTLFGFFALPIISSNLSGLNFKKKRSENGQSNDVVRFFLTSSLAIMIIFVLFLVNVPYWRTKSSFGFGLEGGIEKAAEFFKKENLKGPIFNNYDNGGYLIYYLYPKEKVFVDNRPEAYPKEFFDQVYIPMQDNNDRWKEMERKYNFNTVFFYRHDLTPWAQTFLVSRITDSSWVPIYVDDFSIIFVKRNEVNKKLIERFELPKEMFSVTK